MTDMRMRRGRFGRRGLMLGLLASLTLIAAGCTHPPLGPSLYSVTLDNVSLQPTQGNASLCCCRVVGGATNKNTVPVHVTIKFAAFANAADKDALGTILYFIKDLQPGQTHQIEAPGFIFPCNQIPEGIRNVRTEVEVKGITYPPF